MEIAFYLYTIAVMLICIAAGTLSIAAYFVCRRTVFLSAMTLFLFYFFDLAFIFQYEYFGQNLTYAVESFYAIENPALKIFFSLGMLQSLWMIICEYLDKHNKVLIAAPGIAFIIISTVPLIALPESNLQQWLFYSARQMYLFWMGGYCLLHYSKTKDPVERIRLRRHAPLAIAVVVLGICIMLEDLIMILVWEPSPASGQSLLLMYISERNFSENVLILLLAFVSLKSIAKILRLRFDEPPLADTDDRRRHVEDLMPAFCARHNLTARERVILEQILAGKDNQNIASDLQVAIGTVKTHTHNIFKKTGTSTRQELVREFWKE